MRTLQVSSTTRQGEPRKISAHLTPEMRDYVAREIIEANESPNRVSEEEWDAVQARRTWTHDEIAEELQITYERVRYIRKMKRPDYRRTPAYDRIAVRSGCSYDQVRQIAKDLVVLRDAQAETPVFPPDGGTFT